MTDPDRNLLFGVLALQADFIDPARFAEACTAWSGRKDAALADVLVERGWLSSEDRKRIEYLVDRKLQKHRGDAHASLAEVTTDGVRELLHGVTDVEVRSSLAATLGHGATEQSRTVEHVPEGRQ